MASIHENKRASATAKRWEIHWRGPDLNERGHLRQRMRAFASREEAQAFLDALPPVNQVPARCNCPEPGRWVLVDATVLALGPVTCSICGKPFAVVEPEN
jgi:hypothetical protein